MRNTIYNRIRLGVIIMCLALIIACAIPVLAFAAEQDNSEQDSVHFINPTAMTVVDDYLYVADNVEDGKTALLCFDLTDARSPKLIYTFELSEKITGLSNNGDKLLYAICGTKIIELSTNGREEPTVGKTYDKFGDSENVQIVSVAYGAQFRLDENTLYALSTDKMFYLSAEQNKFIQFTSIVDLKNTKGCYILEENGSSFLYYVANNTCARFNISTNGADTAFSNTLNITVTPSGIFGGKIDDDSFVGLYDAKGIFKIEGSGSIQSGTLRYDTISLFKEPTSVYTNDSIVTVEMHKNKLIVLNSRNQIDIFELADNGFYKHEPLTTIGSDMVDKAVPTVYKNFTLVRPNGYPANIIYKTNGDKSIEEIITDASEYIIIGYDGDENSHYYYVLAGDKFGWVKKSDNAATPDKDDKLTVVNNNFNDGTFAHETKFTSLNAVYVYQLPLESSDKVTVTQTASTMKTVYVLQKYTEGETVWYFVKYDDDKTGFVKKSDVGDIHISAKTDDIVTEGLRKINSSLFSAVNLYVTAEMNENDFVADSDGNRIKLYSGDRVTLIKTEKNAAYIMVLHSDGEKDFGWLDVSRLIDVHHITTNAIVGLSLLAVAIALTAILLVVYFKRKKKIKRNNG